MTGLLRFSMGRRQDDSKEKTWRIEHSDIQELHRPGTKDTKNYTSLKNMYYEDVVMVKNKDHR